jgi:hypothetical protein
MFSIRRTSKINIQKIVFQGQQRKFSKVNKEKALPIPYIDAVQNST